MKKTWPSATEFSLIANEDHTFSLTMDQLLAYASNIDGSNLQITEISSAYGEIIKNRDQTWTFIPEENFYGIFNLHFTVSDGKSSKDQHVLIDLNPELDFSLDNISNVMDDEIEDTTLLPEIEDDLLSLPTTNEVTNNDDGTVTYLSPEEYSNRRFIQRLLSNSTDSE
jgi:hypothetical protein